MRVAGYTPPEVIKEHGNAQDWRNLVGTGPYELADWVEGSSITYSKNPNYWAFDEKYPDNRLPYADEMKLLFMTDRAAQMVALRTGKLALVDALGRDDAESLQRTNPELVMTTAIYGKLQTTFALDVRQPPFDDIRVRQAMQLAIDIEAINQSLYNGLADTTPQGILARESIGYNTPFEELPEGLRRWDPATCCCCASTPFTRRRRPRIGASRYRCAPAIRRRQSTGIGWPAVPHPV